MTETDITQAIIAYIKQQGGDAFHVHGSSVQRAGEPDIDGALFDAKRNVWVHLKIEVKTPIGTPTRLQIFRLQMYWSQGYLVGIVTSVNDFIKLFNAYSEWKRSGTTLAFNRLFKNEWGIYA